MPARILHILHSAEAEHSAFAKMFLTLARSIDANQYELHACFLGADGPWADCMRNLSLPVHHVQWTAEREDLLGAYNFWRFVRANRFDLVHQHYGGRSVRFVARHAGVRHIVLHLHSRVLEHTQVQPVKTTSATDADAVIATSRAVAECVDSDNVRVVYPGFQLPAPLPSRLGDVITIGAACRLVALKGLEYLLPAFASVHRRWPKMRLEIAGNGPLESQLRATASELGIAKRVCFRGWVAHIEQATAEWDIFVAPSLEEGFGMAIGEAMAAGLPVVATLVGGIPELVEHGRSGILVQPRDADALIGAVSTLLEDPTLRTRLGQTARTTIRDRFSIERFVDGVTRTYAELLADRSR
jgi:glycosyltransferase involved in cell wall biosynthesis